MRSAVASLLAGAVVFATTAARAQSDADSAHARALYDEAGQLEREGSWSAAQERLRAALKLRETPHLHYALGWALENDDRLVEAKLEYETAVRRGREPPAAPEAVRLATTRLAALEKNLPSVRVRVMPRSPARVVVDGREQRRDGDVVVTVVDPGTHVVRVERDGASSFERMVYVGRGGVASISVGVEPAPPPALPAPPPSPPAPARPRLAPLASAPPKPPSPPRQDVLPWMLLAGGTGALVAGSALLVTSGSGGGDLQGRDIAGLTLGGAGLVASTAAAILLAHAHPGE